jgi:hypothetical protein
MNGRRNRRKRRYARRKTLVEENNIFSLSVFSFCGVLT